MFADFLPLTVRELTEETSIALARGMQRRAIATSLATEPILTNYVQQGSSGPAIVLLHGFDSSVLEFRRLIPLLAPYGEVWAIDLLGFGFTERAAGVIPSPESIKAHLRGCWETLIQRPMILVGASMGGAAAIDFTLTYPEAVEQLVLLDSAGYTAGPSASKMMFPPMGFLATEFLRNLKVRDRISRSAYHDAKWASADALRCGALHLEAPGWRQALIAFTKSGGYGSFAERLGRLEQPTLILWGENDRILGTADAEKFQGAIADSKLIWIPNCGHVPHLEQPELTAQHMRAFLSLG